MKHFFLFVLLATYMVTFVWSIEAGVDELANVDQLEGKLLVPESVQRLTALLYNFQIRGFPTW